VLGLVTVVVDPVKMPRPSSVVVVTEGKRGGTVVVVVVVVGGTVPSRAVVAVGSEEVVDSMGSVTADGDD
jgi:hypothetical protein